MSLQSYRKNLHTVLLIAFLALTAGFYSQASFAQSGNDGRGRAESPSISAQQAAAMVTRQYGGKVISVNVNRRKNGVVYGVKILQDSGHIRTVNVDGQTGAILN